MTIVKSLLTKEFSPCKLKSSLLTTNSNSANLPSGKAADMNGDKVINAADIVMLIDLLTEVQ